MAKVKAKFGRDGVVAESSQNSQTLYDSSRYGELVKGKFQYSFAEALYLVEKGKMEVFDSKGKVSYDDFVKKASKKNKRFWTRYCVFADMRDRGYVVKTALKFGADFRVLFIGIPPPSCHSLGLR